MMQRSGLMKRKSPKGRRSAGLKRGSQAARDYMGRVAALGCAICRRMGWGATPAEVHHRKDGTGLGKRAADEDSCPLCPEHHTGPTGIHQLKSDGFLESYGVTEDDLIRETQRLLGYCPPRGDG